MDIFGGCSKIGSILEEDDKKRDSEPVSETVFAMALWASSHDRVKDY